MSNLVEHTTISDSLAVQSGARRQSVYGGRLLSYSKEVISSGGVKSAVDLVDPGILENYAGLSGCGNDLLSVLAEGAIGYLESRLQIAFLPYVVTFTVQGPADEIRLPLVPVRSGDQGVISSVHEIREGVKQATNISSNYYVQGEFICRRDGAEAVTDCLEVVYSCGYTDLPKELVIAFMQTVSHLFYNRDCSELSYDMIRHYRRQDV